MPDPIERSYNRDEDQKPGRPPRPASEPNGSENTTRNPKTMTDPATGERRPGPPAPNQAETDETPGG